VHPFLLLALYEFQHNFPPVYSPELLPIIESVNIEDISEINALSTSPLVQMIFKEDQDEIA